MMQSFLKFLQQFQKRIFYELFFWSLFGYPADIPKEKPLGPGLKDRASFDLHMNKDNDNKPDAFENASAPSVWLLNTCSFQRDLHTPFLITQTSW